LGVALLRSRAAVVSQSARAVGVVGMQAG
jgi:hypothetical protein